MGMSHSDVASRFAKGGTTGKSSSMFIDGDVIYSYGYHFPLAVRHPHSDWGQGIRYLRNADDYSATTSRHKSVVRSALGWGETNSVGISFRAFKKADLFHSRPHPQDIRIMGIEQYTYIIGKRRQQSVTGTRIFLIDRLDREWVYDHDGLREFTREVEREIRKAA